MKLYVIFNILDVFDKLFASFGAEIYQAVHSTIQAAGASFTTVQLAANLFRLTLDYLLALTYTSLHALLQLLQALSLNVAINSSNNALFALLVSNNFYEIKSFVFKKTDKGKLFKIVIMDGVERFQICVHLTFVLMQTMKSKTLREIYSIGWGVLSTESWLRKFAITAAAVIAIELVCDNTKHAFLSNLNDHSPATYRDFRLRLWQSLSGKQPEEFENLMSFVPVVPAAVVRLALIPAGYSLSCKMYSYAGLCFL